MKCDKCKGDFPEPKIHESYDVPCYLFKGQFRNERKNQADKMGRHWLCEKCHEEYDNALRLILIPIAKKFAEENLK